MKKSLALLALLSASGCYFGRTPTAKTVAYACNAGLVGVGAVGLATANGDEATVARTVSVVPVVVGLAGVLLNLAVETKHAAAAPVSSAGAGATTSPVVLALPPAFDR